MKCPTCAQNTPDSWTAFTTKKPSESGGLERVEDIFANGAWYSVDWMHCANAACGEAVIRVTRTTRKFIGGAPVSEHARWIAVPQFAKARHVDELVPLKFAKNYRQASLILDLSASASAMLSRRILMDLLEDYAGRTEYSLSERINKFNAETKHPRGLRESLHRVREAGDLSAHTKTDKDDQAIIIEVDRDEAEWTLDVIDRLFDYFITTPARDAAMHATIDKKIERAGRDPIASLPDDDLDGSKGVA